MSDYILKFESLIKIPENSTILIRFPELFTLNAEQIVQLKRFRHIAPIDEDLWTAINYLDDQVFAQFVHLIGEKQMEVLKDVFGKAGILVK